MFRWFGFFRRRRRRRLFASPLPTGWRERFEALSFWAHLDAGRQQRLVDTTRILIEEKDWEGCGGLVLDDEVQQTIAATAALLVSQRGGADMVDADPYPNVETILIYPEAFVDPSEQVGPGGVVSQGRVNLGSAWLRGPVILDWSAARTGAANSTDGRNLVIHEFAHKLDMVDGFVDGRPPLEARGVAAHRWRDVMMHEYESLCRASETGRATLLDKYGTVNPAEFFAVAAETFIERGAKLRSRHAALYELLSDYFGLETADWRHDR